MTGHYRIALLLFALFSAAFATNPLEQELRDWLDVFQSLLVPLMFVLVVVAAVAYFIGQLFGAELRARASAYASGLLTAAGIGALVLVLFAVLLPFFRAGGEPSLDFDAQLEQLKTLAESSLVMLIVVLTILSAVTYSAGMLMGAETRARASVWATGMMGGAIVATVLYLLITTIIPGFSRALVLPFNLGQYVEILILIILLVSFILIITYLLSKVFKVPEWEAYLSVEMAQLMNSFLVLLFIIGFFAVSQVVAASLAHAPSPPLAAAYFLRTWIQDTLMTGLFDVFKIQICSSILSTFSRRIGDIALTNVFKIFPGMDTFVSITNVLVFGLMAAYGSISAQIGILTFIDAFAVPLLLPAGLLLRFFPPTRDAGSFLISLAFGFQIVLPTTFVINQLVLQDLEVERYNSPFLLIASLCGPFKYGVAATLINPAVNPIFRGPLAGLGTILMRATSETTLNWISMAEFIPVIRTLALLSLVALFLPALSMVITIAFINSMTKFLVSKV